jgi:hypothetical protein
MSTLRVAGSVRVANNDRRNPGLHMDSFSPQHSTLVNPVVHPNQ